MAEKRSFFEEKVDDSRADESQNLMDSNLLTEGQDESKDESE